MKRIRVLLIALTLILVSVFFGSVYAVNIQAQKTRPFSDDDGTTGAGQKGDSEYRFLRGTGGLNRGYTIFKLFESGDSDYANAYYCLRGRKGFGASSWTDPTTGTTEYTDVSTSAVGYTSLGEMHENSTSVINKFNELYSVNLNETKTINGKTVNLYNAILWVLDNSYIPVNKLNSENEIVYNEANYKKELLKKAGIVKTQMDEITKDDIEVIQQLAIWYFTNYDEQNDEISVSRKEVNVADYLGIVLNGDNSTYNNNMFTGTRLENLNKLYKYLINGAIAANSEYGTGASRKIETDGARAFDKTIKLRIEPVNITIPGQNPAIYYPENHYHKVGPFKIGSNSEKTILSSDITLIDGSGTVVPRYYIINATSSSEIYYFIDAEGNRVDTLNENTQYYIRVDDTFVKGTQGNGQAGISESSSYNMTNVTLELSSTYKTNTAEFFYANSNAGNNQVLAKIDKEEKVEGDRISTKSFDLSLRKFITSIIRNSQNVSFDSREPVINTVNLENGLSTTAIYRHPKNTLTVKTGDTVIYKIRIYNEGEVDGTATEVTDYLPEGLELAANSATNNRYRWTSEDGKTIKTDYLKVNNIQIPAFDKTKTDFATSNSNIRWQRSIEGIGGVYHGLYYTELEVECVVSEKPGEVDKILKNVAEITAAEDVDGNEIKNPGDDRDSEPGNVYEDDKHTPGTEVDGYTPGEQDDDDFEPLKLEKGLFDLSLRKFITSLNGTELEGENSREPRLDVSKLNNPDTTAIYKHPKNKLTVETNDTVIYTIRVYNEGDLDGKATLVTDYLPAGLQMVAGSTINEKWTMYDSEGNVTEDVTKAVKVTTDALKDTTIKAYDSSKTQKVGTENWQKATEGGNSGLYYADLTIECKVVATMGNEDKTLKNVAEITEDTGDDRDSTPGNVFEDDEHTPGTEEDGYTPGEQDDDDFEDLVIPTKKFDLALRKYITKVEKVVEAGRENVAISNARNLDNIDKDKLNTTDEDTTAEYKHKKDPVVVEPGNIVTYTIRIYNEGELAGRATKIVDQLPTGLKFLNVVSGNYELEAYNEETNKVSLKEKSEGNENLAAYNKETKELKYTTIELECEVTETVGENDKILTNIAYISEEYNAVKDLIITNQEGEDRDSEPETAPNKTAEELKTVDEIGYTGKDSHTQSELSNEEYFEGEQDDDDFEKVVIKGKKFDLALRKYITKVERAEENVDFENTRSLTNIDTSKLNNPDTTAEYKHRKDPVEVEPGDVVTYTFKVYNEGDIDGYVTSITDYLPIGLEFDSALNESEEYEYITEEYKDAENNVIGTKLTIMAKAEGAKLFNSIEKYNGTDLKFASIELKLKVTGTVKNEDQILTNVATMSYGPIGADIKDRDSNRTGEVFTEPTKDDLVSESLPGYKGNTNNKDNLADEEYHYTGQEDDDDFEKVIITGKRFDLSLRKYIAAVNGKKLEGENSREPQIDTSKLNTIDETTGNKITTAIYKHSKEPLVVKKGDIVTYKIRIYNEGARDGYATKVTDYLPDGLGFLYTADGTINSGWLLSEDVETKSLYGEDGIYSSEDKVLKKDAYKTVFGDDIDLANIQVITAKSNDEETSKMLYVTRGGTLGETEIKATNLIKAYGSEKQENDKWQQSTNNENDGLFYDELEITCVVLKDNTFQGTLKNVAEITGAEDSEGNEIKNPGDDRDSEPKNVYEDGTHTPGTEVDGYTPGEQDDDDFEPLVLKYFDLALRKFITNIESAGTATEVTSRIPQAKMGEDGNIKYEHTKDPLYVANNDVVTYTIRVFNEGTIAGYAEEVTDDLPEGLLFLPDNKTNKDYGWVMIDKDGNVTENVEEAVKVTTDYLSSDKEKSENRNNLINPFDSSKEISAVEPLNPDYRDVKIAFQVTEPNTSDRILVNSAQISEDSDDDEDSIPDEWNDGEDDQDKEYVKVRYFDLSLLKWVTQSIVTVDGKTTTTNTGFKPNTGKTETTGIRGNNEAEPIAKVELDKKKLDKTTVKFVYKIRVTNEGELEGYATEITDYIPDGLEFNADDNKAFGWEKEGDNKVTTRALETKLLKPGESAELTIVFRWKNNSKNLGLKTNIAAITEDYNEHNSKDIDSTPGDVTKPYEKEQEDDDDFALVMLSLKTGRIADYTLLVTSMIAMLSAGIYLVKKYVLD